jgi:hypothetical protein
MDLVSALDRCRARAAGYFAAQSRQIGDALYWRHSTTHDPVRDPAHLLYGTWGGVFGSRLIRGPQAFGPMERKRIAAGINGFQRPDGTFLPDLKPQELGDHGIEYDTFHFTNYAWGALRALGAAPRFPPAFMERFAAPRVLAEWLARRDLSKPWSEGNNVVNLASFYAIQYEDGSGEALDRLHEMLEWHRREQHPRTGLWHSDAPVRTTHVEYAMAGGAHNLHLFYYLDAPVPNADRIVDSCLELTSLGVVSACIDLDMVDILTHLRRYGHRVDEIDRLLHRYLVELIQVQNADGGFCDNYVAPHRAYGHTTPVGRSVTWVTWFRLATIGMLAGTLMPAQRDRWWFRNTLGSGYHDLARAAGPGSASGTPAVALAAPASLRLWLITRREARWMRQRITSRARRWLKRAS